MRRFCIKEGYQHRESALASDERNITDQCQKEVYEQAALLFMRERLRSVLDVGTGGGYKFQQYFGHVPSHLGLDVEHSVQWLREHRPAGNWEVVDMEYPPRGYDLVICSDVIEHIENPDEMMAYLVGCNPRVLVLSTPDRDRLLRIFHNGPPRNECHFREWTMPEFREYVEQWVEVVDHLAPPPGDVSTQIIIARPRL